MNQDNVITLSELISNRCIVLFPAEMKRLVSHGTKVSPWTKVLYGFAVQVVF